MLTIVPKGLRIIRGGCRYTLYDGRAVEKYCDECNAEGKSCELEACARKLSEISMEKDSAGKDSAASPIAVKPNVNW